MDAQYMSEFLNVLIIHLIGLISPGPNFALVLRSSLLFSRRHAFYTIGGLTAATVIQLFIVLLGLGMIICASPLTVKVIQIFGALFLAYLALDSWGIHLFSSQKKGSPSSPPAKSAPLEEPQPLPQNTEKSVRLAFMTSLLNPMSLLFYVAVFTNEVSMSTPFSLRLLYLVVMAVTYALWFVSVALFFSHKRIQDQFMKAKDFLDRAIGTVLLLFAVKFFFTALYS